MNNIEIPVLPDVSVSFEPAPNVGTLGLNAALCALMIIRIGRYPIRTSILKHGHPSSCLNCCPYNENWEIRFYLYSRNNNEGVLIDNQQQFGLQKAGFNANWPTVFIVHGWGGGVNVMASRVLKDAFVRNAVDRNIIVVDWGAMASLLQYQQAVRNTRTVGRSIANFIVKNKINVASVHLIGFSLGAQIVGFAGKDLIHNYGLTLEKITGIDPAYPQFEDLGCDSRLCITDAKFVDVYHVDAEKLGIPNAVGHMDFFVNGGRKQPDCGRLRVATLGKFFGTSVMPCSHLTGPMYYALTVDDPFRFPVYSEFDPLTLRKMTKLKKSMYMGIDASNYHSNFTNGTKSYFVPAYIRKSPWDVIYGADL